jgi:hypothetical protein
LAVITNSGDNGSKPTHGERDDKRPSLVPEPNGDKLLALADHKNDGKDVGDKGQDRKKKHKRRLSPYWRFLSKAQKLKSWLTFS